MIVLGKKENIGYNQDHCGLDSLKAVDLKSELKAQDLDISCLKTALKERLLQF